MTHPLTHLHDDLLAHRCSVAVVGLGYVGLPLAVRLASRYRVLGFDIDPAKVERLRAGVDPTGEVAAADLAGKDLELTCDPARLQEAGAIIVAVPTPVDGARRPDFRPLSGASRTIAPNLRKGALVIYESTVYPGATEEVCIPILTEVSGLVPGTSLFYGYSPERINPGDRTHTIDKVVKVVSGSDAVTLDQVARLYGEIVTVGVHRAPSIRVAEAAKVIENTQRDLNIALVNELSLIFHRLGIDTLDVLEAAGTKWNFLPFRPGLVGGHCIGVDPYYLTHKAESVGYHPQVILAGRRINDGVGRFVAQECVRLLAEGGGVLKGSRVLILGLTFKEDVPDVRNTRVVDIVAELQRFGCVPVVCDPVADPKAAEHEYGIRLMPMNPLPTVDAVIVAVAHRAVKALAIQTLVACCPSGAPFLDVKGAFDRQAVTAAGLTLWRL